MEQNHNDISAQLDTTGARVIVVTGLRASGKSTLAKRIASELGYELVSQDVVKERLSNSLEKFDTKDESVFAQRAFLEMYRQIAAHLRMPRHSFFGDEEWLKKNAHTFETRQNEILTIGDLQIRFDTNEFVESKIEHLVDACRNF